MKIYFKLIMVLALLVLIGCYSPPPPSRPSQPSLPVERYGTSPGSNWTIVNNSSQPIIIIFKNGLAFTLERGSRRNITVRELIDSGSPLESGVDPNFTYGFRYSNAPTENTIFSYRIIVENGNRVRREHSTGIIFFIDDTTGNEMIAIRNASQTISNSIPKNAKIAIVNISSSDTGQSEFVVGELEVFLVNSGIFVVDRRELDRIRREQRFQLSGDVDDNDVVSIGRFAGADVVITGSISGTGSTRRLRIRALDTQTARVIAAASEAY
jgi:hypothetical protein